MRGTRRIWAPLIAGLVLCLIMARAARPRPRAHLDIRVSIFAFDSSQCVCSVTISNVTATMVVSIPYIDVDFLTNGVWAQTSRGELGGTPGPFFPHQVYRTKIVIPIEARAVRIGAPYEHMPRLVEGIAGLLGRVSSGVWPLAYRMSSHTATTDWSDVLIIQAPTNNPQANFDKNGRAPP